MTLESLVGNLFVLAAVIVILVVYRQLDKNNRSLEKIRKFAEGVRDDLNAFVEERTAAVRDLEAVLKVHDKTGAEILKRIQSFETGLLSRLPEIEQLQARLDRYAGSMTELETQTKRIDTHLERVKEETIFVDRVSQRIKTAGEQMTGLEASFGRIRQEFTDINQKDLEAVRENATEVFEKETRVYVNKLAEAQLRVDGFEAFVAELESKKSAFIRETEAALDAKSREALAGAEAALIDTARQAEDLSMVVFLKLEEKIENQAKDSETRLLAAFDEREAGVKAKADGIDAESKETEARLRAVLDEREAAVRAKADEIDTFTKESELRLLAVLHERETSVRAKADAIDALAQESEMRLRAVLDDREAALRAAVAEIATQSKESEARLLAVLGEHEAGVKAKADSIDALARESDAALRTALDERAASVRASVADIMAQLELIGATVAERTAVLDGLRSQSDETIAELRDDFQTEQAQLMSLAAQLKTDLEVAVSEARRLAERDAAALREDFRNALEADSQKIDAVLAERTALLDSLGAKADEAVELLEQKFQTEHDAITGMTTELKADLDARVAEVRGHIAADELRTVESLENRLTEYEAAFSQRFTRLEETEKELTALDQNLRQSMETASAKILAEFAAFDAAMAQRRQDEQDELDKKLGTSQESLVRLDQDLEELKARAYENVSQKFQGVEEQFFADLQRRAASMTQSVEDWQTDLNTRFEDLREAANRERTESERQTTEALRARFQELQGASLQQLERLERQIQDAQESAGASVSSYREDVEKTRTALAEELAALERVMEMRLGQDKSRIELTATESLTKLERDIDSKVKMLADDLARVQGDYRSGLDNAQTEFSLWQTKFAQRFKELDADFQEQQNLLKASIAEKIGLLAEEFTRQKEELVVRSVEDRQSLKNDLSQIRSLIDELDTSLRSRGQVATEAFAREYEELSQEFQRKNRELTNDVENRLKEYREAVVDTREKAEVQQKKAFAKIEDQTALLNVALEEIEKRQKNFVVQTKIFDRADTLKEELQVAVDDLKADIARVEVQRKDLFEIEAAVARIKKIGDETSDKAAKFTAEKKRIDLMDADFQRIVGLSQSMELRLEQVTSSHDLLQEMQLRIRKLEEYSKDVETRYERLEKRREVLDTTTDGVDRNFSLLEKIEKTVRGLDAELKAMPGEVEDLRKRLKVLAQGKEDADHAVERLGMLDQTLKDVESRIGRMEQAREWIAGVETRLTETKEAAEEQVQTLATIHKAAGAPAKGKAGDSDMRQTVLKLARQGWGKEEISRATKLSLGEVELILELGPR